MNFNNHSRLEGQHAFLSASKYHWINYDEDKLLNSFCKYQAAQRGTELHELAKTLINLRVKLPKTRKTLNLYVNDGIGFKMQTEQTLYFSENCFGTADTISFRYEAPFKNEVLRIHDLKNGETPASVNQLMVYDSLFCLEYKVNPNDICHELRLYQADTVSITTPDPEDILAIMGKIMHFDEMIEKIKAGG